MKIRIVILSAVMLLAAAAISYASRPEIIPIRQSLEGLPMHFAGWEGMRSSDMEQKVQDLLGVDDYIRRVYYQGNSLPVSLYIGYHDSQRAGDTIHSPMNCMPGSGWLPVRNERISIPVNNGEDIVVNRITIQKGDVSQVVLYWYQSQGRVIASEYIGKIHTVLGAMRYNRTDAALLRIVSPLPSNAESKAEAETIAEKTAIEFVQALFPLLSDFLPD
ncbi:MAG: EpsI family protein [Acidobacteriota bacterium]|jgi:EpsI family protein|nr:EpsI family protein [Acidobacteriota bacterium]